VVLNSCCAALVLTQIEVVRCGIAAWVPRGTSGAIGEVLQH
jgi:hypothetical protein